MMKKFFAALTAMACALPAVPAFTASAFSWEEPTDYMVTEMRISEENGYMAITLREIGTPTMWTLSDCGADIAAMLEGQELPEYGDIISLSVPDTVAEIYPGCLHYTAEDPPVFENHGNITEIGVPEYFSIVGYEEYNGRITECHLEDEYNETYRYYPDAEYNLPAPDVTQSEETLWYMYNGEVVIPADEDTVDSWYIPWTATGIIIGPELIGLSQSGACIFRDKVDSYGDAIGAGDVVEIKIRGGIAETYPGQLPAIEHIDRIGTAAEVYGYGTYTVTENDGMILSLTDETGAEVTYSYDLQAEMGYELYNSELVIDAQAGDVITFMDDENGNPIVPVNPENLESRTEFAVIGVDDPEAPQSYIIMESDSPTAVYQLHAYELEPYLANGGTPLSYGDIFTLAGSYEYTCIWGTNDIYMHDPESIRIEGSVFDKAETAEFTFSAGSANSFVWLAGEGTGYNYPVDFVLGTCLMFDDLHVQPDGIDWSKPVEDDKVIMYTYNGVPMLPKALQRIGDADGDNEVNASDAAELLITAAENGAGLARAVTFSSDVNADGAVDAQDAGAVLMYAAAKGIGGAFSWTEVRAE